MPSTRAVAVASALPRVLGSALAIRYAGSDAGLHEAALRNLGVYWNKLHEACWSCADDIADLERKLQFDREDKVHQMRNRHVLLRTSRILPHDEAVRALAGDPGLVAIDSWDEGGAKMLMLARRDAGCASCGRSFELDGCGEPMRSEPGAQLVLFGKEAARSGSAAFDHSGHDLPAGRIACPRCGWAAPFAWHAEELMITLDWPLIRVRPSTTPLEWLTRSLGLSYGVLPGPFELEVDLMSGMAWLNGWQVPEDGLAREAAELLDEYPIVPAVTALLRKQNVDLAFAFPGQIQSVSDLIAAARRR